MHHALINSQAYSENGRYSAEMAERQASTIHKAQAKSLVQFPHAGTHTKQIMFTMVASPMGNVLKNIDWAGSFMIVLRVSGYIM
jgi:plasmid stabilization system protein ParE